MPHHGEVREIGWHAVSAKEQAHQMCRYCDTRASKMRYQGRQGWVPVCYWHALDRRSRKRFALDRPIRHPRQDVGG